MRRIFLMLFISSMVFFLTGCVGLLIAPMREASFTATGKLKNEEPLKCSKSQALAVKKVAIFPYGEYIKEPNVLKMYIAGMDILISEIEKSGRFTIISGSKFKKKQDELGLKISTGMMQSDMNELVSTVAKALNCDAVLAMTMRQKKINMPLSFLKAGFVGTIDAPMSVFLQIESSKDCKTIWEQEHDFVFTAGDMGLTNTPYNELKTKFIPVIKPLVDNLLSSF